MTRAVLLPLLLLLLAYSSLLVGCMGSNVLHPHTAKKDSALVPSAQATMTAAAAAAGVAKTRWRCRYAVLLWCGDGGRYFAVAPSQPYDDNFRTALAADVLHMLQGTPPPSHTTTPPSSSSPPRHCVTVSLSTANTDVLATDKATASAVNVTTIGKFFSGVVDFVAADVVVTYDVNDAKATRLVQTGSSSSSSSSHDVVRVRAEGEADTAATLVAPSKATNNKVAGGGDDDGAVVVLDTAGLTTVQSNFFFSLTRRTDAARVRRASMFAGLSVSTLRAVASVCAAAGAPTDAAACVAAWHAQGATTTTMRAGEGEADVAVSDAAVVEVATYYTFRPRTGARALFVFAAVVCALLCLLLVCGPCVMYVVRRRVRRAQSRSDEQRLLDNLNLFDKQQQQQPQQPQPQQQQPLSGRHHAASTARGSRGGRGN